MPHHYTYDLGLPMVSDTENFDCAPGTEAVRIPGEGTVPRDVTSKQAYDELMREKAKRTPAALQTQVAGSHYKDMKIQPLEYCHANNIGKIEGDVIAYVSRWRKKGGITDLKKSIHELEILIELETRNGVGSEK